MALFALPDKEEIKEQQKRNKKSGSSIELKKGQTVDALIEMARNIVEEKLGKYKDTSRCVIDVEDLQSFFDETPENAYVAIDTETTGLDTYLDELVGVCLCNGKQSIYVPLNHKSAVYGDRLNDTLQMNPNKFRELFDKLLNERHFKYVFHNAKFDLSVMRTFMGRPMPDPYWDTLIGRTTYKSRRRPRVKIFV